jgi:replicative DNA helicase
VLQNAGSSSTSLADAVAGLAGGREAHQRIQAYAERLLLVVAGSRRTGLDEIREFIRRTVERGQPPVVVVDYLQKVALPRRPETGDEHATLVVEGLKDIALELAVPIIAVTAADKEGLESGKRLRIKDLRGSTSLGYEPDVVLVFNDKYDIVARHHLVYDVGNAGRFHDWAVLTLEKNRGGPAGIDLQFHKEFERGRFDPDGDLVSEQLVDERVYVE